MLFRCQDRSGNLALKGYGVFKLGRTSTRFHQYTPDPRMDGYHMGTHTVLGHRQYAMTHHALRDPSPAPPGWRRYVGTPVNSRELDRRGHRPQRATPGACSRRGPLTGGAGLPWTRPGPSMPDLLEDAPAACSMAVVADGW